MKRLFLLGIIVLVLLVGYVFLTLPDVSALATQMPKTTAFMEKRRADLRAEGKSDTLDWRPVSYDRISPYLRRGVLVAEDNDFYEHNGVDVKGMQEALERDWAKKRFTNGGSTITQQLAKNLYLSSSRNPLRKIQEYFIARSLERHLSKKRILELYLNVVEMGERIYGAEAAARTYFHTSASALSPQQAALLAGCLPNPRVMVPAAPNKRLRARQKMILSRMRRWGYAAEKEVLTTQKKVEEAPLEQTKPTDTATPSTPPTETVPPTDTTATTDTTSTETTGTQSRDEG
jgi:monofunctional biosynthetic peptidoglycan transglycosylase